MNYKKIVCIVIFALGIAGIIYAVHGKYRIASARSDVSSTKNFFQDNPVSNFVSGSLNRRIDNYARQANILLAVGIVFVIAGGTGFVYLSRKKKR